MLNPRGGIEAITLGLQKRKNNDHWVVMIKLNGRYYSRKNGLLGTEVLVRKCMQIVTKQLRLKNLSDKFDSFKSPVEEAKVEIKKLEGEKENYYWYRNVLHLLGYQSAAVIPVVYN